MIALTQTAPTIQDLKERMAALYEQLKQAERAAAGDIDPEWLAVAHTVTVYLDAAEEALTQADLACTGGDMQRAQSRRALAWDKFKLAGSVLDEWEADYGG